MEWLTQFADILRDNWAKVLLWVTAPVVGGISVWQIFSFIVSCVKNRTAKKYIEPLKAEFNDLKQSVEQFKGDVASILAEKVDEYSNKLVVQFNELAEKMQARKQEIYEEIVGIPSTPEVVEQKIESVTKTNETEFDNITEEAEKVEEEPTTTEETEQNGNGDLKTSKSVDLL